MIDIESRIATKVKEQLPSGVDISDPYDKNARTLPLVTLSQIENSIYERFINSAQIENAVNVTIEVNVYSNKTNGKKTECKNIMKIVDDVMTELGFTRTMCRPTPNLEDATVYRITARYRAVVDSDFKIYRR